MILQNRNLHIIFVILFVGMIVFIVYCLINTYYNRHSVKDETEMVELTELDFDRQHYKLDDIKSDSIVNYKFVVKNTGNNPLYIYSVNPNCLCTGYHVSKTKIGLGDTAQIVLTLDTHNKKGFYTVNTIVTANTLKKYYLLKLVGEIVSK